jgi:hypothetical protein
MGPPAARAKGRRRSVPWISAQVPVAFPASRLRLRPAVTVSCLRPLADGAPVRARRGDLSKPSPRGAAHRPPHTELSVPAEIPPFG